MTELRLISSDTPIMHNGKQVGIVHIRQYMEIADVIIEMTANDTFVISGLDFPETAEAVNDITLAADTVLTLTGRIHD